MCAITPGHCRGGISRRETGLWLHASRHRLSIAASATSSVFLLGLVRTFIGAGCISPACRAPSAGPEPITTHLCCRRDAPHGDVEPQKHQLQQWLREEQHMRRAAWFRFLEGGRVVVVFLMIFFFLPNATLNFSSKSYFALRRLFGTGYPCCCSPRNQNCKQRS